MSKPDVKNMTAKELGDRLLLRCGRELAARVEKVLALHQKQTNLSRQEFCWAGCAGHWPCKTVRLLNGEDP